MIAAWNATTEKAWLVLSLIRYFFFLVFNLDHPCNLEPDVAFNPRLPWVIKRSRNKWTKLGHFFFSLLFLYCHAGLVRVRGFARCQKYVHTNHNCNVTNCPLSCLYTYIYVCFSLTGPDTMAKKLMMIWRKKKSDPIFACRIPIIIRKVRVVSWQLGNPLAPRLGIVMKGWPLGGWCVYQPGLAANILIPYVLFLAISSKRWISLPSKWSGKTIL